MLLDVNQPLLVKAACAPPPPSIELLFKIQNVELHFKTKSVASGSMTIVGRSSGLSPSRSCDGDFSL